MISHFTSTQLLAAGLWLCKVSTAESTGSFDFVTYNVAGLPEFLNDNGVPGDKDTNANTIGSHLADGGYDIAQLQEDFAYHDNIYDTDTHTYRTPTSGNVPFGDGLNTVANYNWTGLSREKWDKCDINEADCLTPKGFAFMRMSIDDIEVDLYNFHADAGSNQGDIDARSAGIDQLLDYVNSNSQDRAVIIAGDSNDRWTNEDLSVNKLTDADFEDVWVTLVKDGEFPEPGSTENACDVPAADKDCETVDKVFFRSGNSVTLTATSFEYIADVFVQPDGNILSDHNPIHVKFSWSA